MFFFFINRLKTISKQMLNVICYTYLFSTNTKIKISTCFLLYQWTEVLILNLFHEPCQ